MKVGSVVEDFSSGSDALIGARQSLQFSHRELEGEAGILSSFGLQLGPGSPSHGHPTQPNNETITAPRSKRSSMVAIRVNPGRPLR
jgi:hypothetical protein